MAKAVGPYSPVIAAASWVITSGQIGLIDDASGGRRLAEGGLEAELRAALANAESLLADHGLGLHDVIKTTVFLTDLAEYALLNEVWMDCFGEHRPTRSAVEVSALPLGACVEVECWALQRP